jgi:predicted Zn-dependent protease
MRKILGLARTLIGLGAIALVASACLATNLAPIGEKTGAFTPEHDEAQLWSALRQAEDKVAPQNVIYQDARLTTYLSDLVNRLTPAGYREAGGPPIRVLVRKDPRLNAGAMAQGLIVINTGILARVDNEAQLAAVLAHELTHITNRHQVREYRALQNRQTAINVAAFLGTLALTAAAIDQERRGNPAAAQAITTAGAPLLQVGLQLTFTAMVSGYSREMESEADAHGLRVMANAGYPPEEMSRFFRVMLAEAPDRGSIETFFWGSHPRTSGRVEAAETFARAYGPLASPRINSPEFEARTSVVRALNAQWDAYIGRAALAQSQVDRTVRALPERPEKVVLTRLLYANLEAAAATGAASRGQTSTATDRFTRAVSLYQAVIEDAPKTPGAASIQAQAYKSLGNLHYLHRDTRGRPCEAKAALAKYLEIMPTAPDRTVVAQKLRDLSCAADVRSDSSSDSFPPLTLGRKPNAREVPLCPSGEYWSSGAGRCQRIGE